jgi:glucokinase
VEVTHGLVLAGDVGGTKTLLLLARHSELGMERLAQARYASADWTGMDTMVQDFLHRNAGQPKPENVCLAVAGPAETGKAKLTNLPWSVDADALCEAFGFQRVEVVNDFAAVAGGLGMLANNDLVSLQPGETVGGGARLAIGAGTGLGVAYVLADGTVLPTEGGHVGFAPADDLQIELLKYMQLRHGGRASIERLLSGRGIVDIHRFLTGREGREAEWPASHDDPAAAISNAALSGGDEMAARTLRLFAQILGAVAGDFALAGLARGGVYVAGGIAPKILSFLRDGNFIAAFVDKGRFADWARQVPVRVVMNTEIGLLGAAAWASRPSST